MNSFLHKNPCTVSVLCYKQCSPQFLEGKLVKKKEIEATVEYFPRTLIAGKCGLAKTPDGRRVHIPAREFLQGFNGSRVFSKKGDLIVATVVEDGEDLLALNWGPKNRPAR